MASSQSYIIFPQINADTHQSTIITAVITAEPCNKLVGVNVEWSDNAQYRMQGILSAAFDTIDHTILLGTILFSNGRLENVGNKGMALS